MCICAAPVTPWEGVTVYGRRDAGDFRQVQTFLEDRGVIFEYADIEGDRANSDRMLKLSGQKEAVVIEIGQKILVGFNPNELDAVLP